MTLTFRETCLLGAYVLEPHTFIDTRGTLVKTFHEGSFRGAGIEFAPREQFVSISELDVLRGMHFQSPPYVQQKLVCCLHGEILDVLLDLRVGSPTYSESFAVELSGANHLGVFVPEGFAHGFLSLSGDATVMYLADCVHHPEAEAGVLWDSFGFSWPSPSPQLSDRDRGLTPMTRLQSPFSA